MTNGIDHHQGGSGSPKPPAPKATQQAPAKPKAPDAKASPPPGGAK